MTAHYYLNGQRIQVDAPALPLSTFRQLFRSGYWLLPSSNGSRWVVFPRTTQRIIANQRWGTFSPQELIKFVNNF